MKICLEGFFILLLYPPTPQGHLSSFVYTKRLINALANPVLNAAPHHTNLIIQQRLCKLKLSMHQNQAALKCFTNLDYVQ